MRRWLLLLIALPLIAACSGGGGNSWAEKTYGKALAQKLLDEAGSSRLVGSPSEPYLQKRFVVLEAKLEEPDITQVKELVYHPMNVGLKDLGVTDDELKTLVVVQKNYKFLPNADGKSERAERDGWLIRLIDREKKSVTSFKMDSFSSEALEAKLAGPPDKPSDRKR